MGSPITLKSWFASVEPGAPPGDRSLAVWIFGLRGEEEEPVALQLKERLGKDSFRTEVDGERRIVKLEGPLATDRAKTAGVDEMYINTFKDGITEHLEFTLHAALALPPHKVRLSVAFPRFLRSSPNKKQSSPKKSPAVPDEPLPDSLFDLGTGYQSPARARRTRKQLAEELHAARQRRDPFDPIEPPSTPPSEADAILSAPAIPAKAPPASSASQPAKTPLRSRPSSKKARLASLTASFFKSRPTTPSGSTSVAAPSRNAVPTSASTSTIAAVLSTFFQKQPPSSPPPASKPTAPKSPARTPVKRVVALADCLASSSPALVSRLEKAADGAKTATPDRSDATEHAKVEEAEQVVENVETEIEQNAPEPTAAEPAETGAAFAEAEQPAATVVEVTMRADDQEKRAEETIVVDKQEEKAGPMDIDQDATPVPPPRIAATPPPPPGPPRQPTASPFARLHSHTASPRRSPFLASPRAAGVAPSERYSSIEPTFPSSQGGISSLFHDSADEGDGDDDSADLTAQQISEFVERDLASSVVDEDEYKRERAPKSSAGGRPPKELLATPVIEAPAPAGAVSAVEQDAVDQDQQRVPTPAPAPTASAETVHVAAPSQECAPAPVVESSAAPVEPEPQHEPEPELEPESAFEATASTSTAPPPPPPAAAEPIAPPQHDEQPALPAQNDQLSEPPAEPPVHLHGVSSVPSPELASYDAAKESIETAAQEATEQVVSRAVGSAVEPVAGPVIGDALAEIAARASGEVITGVVGNIVDAAVQAVAQAVQVDDEEKTVNGQKSDEEKQDEPASSHSGAMGSQEPQDQQESQEPPAAAAPMADDFVEQDFLEPEQSKDHEGGAEFAAEYWAQIQAGGFAADDAEAIDGSVHVEEPSKKPLSDAFPRSSTSPNGSILSRDAAALASDPVALAALSALRNEPEPEDLHNGSAPIAQTPAGLSRTSSHDVFGPVDHVQKPPSSSTPSQETRPPRARTLSARQQAAPAQEPASRPPGKKAHRRGSTFIGVEIIVSPRKRPARARNSTAQPAASTSRAGPAKEVAHSPVEPNIFDSPAAPSPPPPAGSKSWLDAPVEASRVQPAGQQEADGESQDDLEDESDDPLAEPIAGNKRQNASQRLPVRRSIAPAKVANGRESSSDASSDDEAVAKRLLNGTSTTDYPNARPAVEDEAERVEDDSKVRQRSEDDSALQRKKRARDATPPSKAKRRRVSSTSASQPAPSTSQQVPRRPSLAGKIRQPSASQPTPAARGTPARVESASAARRKSRSAADASTPGSMARPARSRKPVDGWWDISRGEEAATSSAKKRKRNEVELGEGDENDEQEEQHKVVERKRKRRAIESSPELGADVEAQERHAEREESVAHEDDGYDNSRDDDFHPSADAEVEEDDEALASPKPAKKAPIPKASPANGANSGKKKRRKRKSLVMPTFRNRKRQQSAAAAASASASPAPSHTPDPRPSLAGKGTKVLQEEREQGLARASSVKKARKEAANREEVRESSTARSKPTQAKGRPAQQKKVKKKAVELPEWAEGDEWASLREVGIAREADEDPFHFSD
ncbi:Cell wall surface anchor family protein [Rhodotorula toruloides ATCC 204091]|uniref:BY PROTMAP: gi/342319905/gb/EGU11850.1/ Cell wall surface anchor family protein [Rhodotorula glutinis ATCC 204091] n=1 Tax=Rhodotorula toruloides TaxID=5286 RepID=A0A0K3C938_RHOTO|nr:Cell wall surface anchor family protein [Rhodotorula toruloides ATCC 204091]